MAFQINEKIGDGGYGHVYKGRDHNLERDVAIKFIRTNAGTEAFAKDQAQALSRCQSQNVVTVYSLEELEDPAVKTVKLALIMELLPGDTVLNLVTKGALSLEEARRIGLGTINGLEEIHNAGLIHGDLSLDNVMASERFVKIIDILYKHTLAGGDTDTRDMLRLDDRNSLRALLTKLLRSINPTQADVFTKSLTPESSLADIRQAFDSATDPKLIIDVPKLVEHYLKLFSEDSFSDSEEYAEALSEEIPDSVVLPLLEAMISNGGIPKKRTRFVDRLWKRLDVNGKRIIGAKLSEALTREVPDGSWPPLLRTLNAFGKTGWASLSKVCRLRLETALVDDIKKGYLDTYGNHPERGQFGTWTVLFYSAFGKPEEVIDAIVPRLHGSWYTQNYIGESFMRFLPRLVKKPEDRQRLIKGLVSAVMNDAHRVRNNLGQLPDDWQAEINAEVERRTEPVEEGDP